MSGSGSQATPSADSASEDNAEDTASSPSKAPASGAEIKSWSKDSSVLLLRLLLQSLFFVLPKPGKELTQLTSEACKKVVIQNLIHRVLLGVDLNVFKAGGVWGKAVTGAIRTRKALQKDKITQESDHSNHSGCGQNESPQCAPFTRGIDGALIPPPPSKPRAVSGYQRGSDLESHARASFKPKIKQTRRNTIKVLEDADSKLDEDDEKKSKTLADWFDADGISYRRGIKLNPDFITKNAEGELIFFFPFLTTSDARCDEATRELANMLKVTDIRTWSYKLSELEAEPVAWGIAKHKLQAGLGALSERTALLKGSQTPNFGLDCRPSCIVDGSDSEWLCIFLNKPGGFLTVDEVAFRVKNEPGAECLIIKLGKGAKGPEYICNEHLGNSPNKVLVKRKFSQLETRPQPLLEGWADIVVPLSERTLDFKTSEKKRIKNGMILLLIKKLPPKDEEELIEL